MSDDDRTTGTDAGPHPSRLRDEIDRGRTGDKVAAEDPAVVPLGTDDEAAGTAPSGGRVEEALRREQRNVSPGEGTAGTATWVTVAATAVLLTIVLLVIAKWLG